MAIFSPTQLAQAVATAAPLVPTGHTNAIIGTVDSTGAQVVLVLKLGDNDRWRATAVGRHDWTGDDSVGGSVVYSW